MEENAKKYRCLSVRQPYADLLTKATFDGVEWTAKKSIEVRSRNTNYRGDILICATRKPVVAGCLTGCAAGLVEVVGTKPLEAFTEEDWEKTCIPKKERKQYKGYGWILTNPRRVIEVPVIGRLGFFDIVDVDGAICEYPRVLKVDAESWEIIKKKSNAKI